MDLGFFLLNEGNLPFSDDNLRCTGLIMVIPTISCEPDSILITVPSPMSIPSAFWGLPTKYTEHRHLHHNPN
jgi:hypothetical protein